MNSTTLKLQLEIILKLPQLHFTAKVLSYSRTKRYVSLKRVSRFPNRRFRSMNLESGFNLVSLLIQSLLSIYSGNARSQQSVYKYFNGM